MLMRDGEAGGVLMFSSLQAWPGKSRYPDASTHRTIRFRVGLLANVLALALLAMLLAACSTPAGNANGGSGTLQVVAGENFWGSIAAQLGGSHVQDRKSTRLNSSHV